MIELLDRSLSQCRILLVVVGQSNTYCYMRESIHTKRKTYFLPLHGPHTTWGKSEAGEKNELFSRALNEKRGEIDTRSFFPLFFMEPIKGLCSAIYCRTYIPCMLRQY